MRIINSVILIVMISLCGQVNAVVASVDTSYQSQVVTGFYGKYVFSEPTGQSTAQPNESSMELPSHLPTTGDTQTGLLFTADLLIIASLTRGIQIIEQAQRNQRMIT